MAISFKPFTIRFDYRSTGLPNKFQPEWGMTRGKTGRGDPIIVGDGHDDDSIFVSRSYDGIIVIEPSKEDPEREVVMFQSYATGVGAKRYPSVKIDVDNLESVSVIEKWATSGGSGGETWFLIDAPLGFSKLVHDGLKGKNKRDGQDVVVNNDIISCLSSVTIEDMLRKEKIWKDGD